jgi:hypothetical protein
MSENREFYRTKMNSPGFLIEPSGEVQFKVRDLSLKGFLAHFDNAPSCEEGTMARVRLPALDMERSAMVIRIKAEKEGGYKVGFLFCESAATPPASFIPGKGLSDEDDLMDLLF